MLTPARRRSLLHFCMVQKEPFSGAKRVFDAEFCKEKDTWGMRDR